MMNANIVKHNMHNANDVTEFTRKSFTRLRLGFHWLCTLREESSQTNVILQYKLLAAIVSAVCSVIQQS